MLVTDEVSDLSLVTCAGTSMDIEATQCLGSALIKLWSVTILATTNSSSIDAEYPACYQMSECQRVVIGSKLD